MTMAHDQATLYCLPVGISGSVKWREKSELPGIRIADPSRFGWEEDDAWLVPSTKNTLVMRL